MLMTEVRQAFFDALSPILTPAGFKGNRKNQEFSRKFPGGKHRIILPALDRAPVLVGVAVTGLMRIDAVEDLVNRFDTTLMPSYASTSTTLIVRPDAFGRPMEFLVHSPDELAVRLAEMRPFVENELLPMMSRCESLVEVECVLNGEFGKKVAFPPARHAMRGMASASFAAPDRLTELAAMYRAQLEGRSLLKERADFERLVEHVSCPSVV